MKNFALFISFVISGLLSTNAVASGAPAKAATDYVSLQEPVIVNVADANPAYTRHMQVKVHFKLEKPEYSQFISKYEPALTHSLVMTLSELPVAELTTAEGKRQMREKALAQTQAVMQDSIGLPAISAIYFTDMIIQ